MEELQSETLTVPRDVSILESPEGHNRSTVLASGAKIHARSEVLGARVGGTAVRGHKKSGLQDENDLQGDLMTGKQRSRTVHVSVNKQHVTQYSFTSKKDSKDSEVQKTVGSEDIGASESSHRDSEFTASKHESRSAHRTAKPSVFTANRV